MKDTAAFIRQVETMYQRLGQLYTDATSSNGAPATTFLPIIFKDLGVAAEELQVASEELTQQNEELSATLYESTEKFEYYHSLFDLAPQAQLVTNLDGKIQEANQAAARLFNVSQSALVDKLLSSFIPQNYRLPFRSQLNRLLQVKRASTWSTYLQPQNSNDFTHLIVSAVVSQQIGSVPTIYWTLQEESDLRTALSTSPVEQVVPRLNGKPSNTADAGANQALAALDRRPQHVFLKGEPIPLKHQAIWQVRSGLVKLSTLTEADEEILLGLVGPTMPFMTGSVSLLTYQAVAMSDVQLVSISVSEVNASPSLAQMLLPKFQQRLKQAEALLNVAGQRPVKNRLYQLLLLLKQEIGEPVDGGIRLGVRLTHEDIANSCCTTRVTVTRLLGDLQRQDKVSFDRKYHMILSEDF